MKIIDTFLFSEPMEANLLLVKFNCEYDYVDKFILMENTYTSKGEYKGIFAQQLLTSDKRFEKFLDKIHIISADENVAEGVDETANFKRENWQRTICADYLFANYSDEDYIMISDTDELIDFSDEKRRQAVFSGLSNLPYNGICSLRRQRYWFDFDNICYHNALWIPLVSIGFIKIYGAHAFLARQYETPRLDTGDIICGFEYSYCLRSSDELLVKKITFPHTGFVKKDIEDALEINSWIRSPIRGEYIQLDKREEWFETIPLTEDNSPKYVRDNLEWLKTHVVNKNYKENRKKKYPTIKF